MKRDMARDSMPEASLWNAENVLPERLGTRLRKRGGYNHASASISAVTASASYIAAGIFAPYSDGDSNLCFDEDGRVYEIESTTGTENIGAVVATLNPVFYDNKVIVPDSAGSTAPKQITRSSGTHSVTALGGSPPAGKYALIYKDVLWLAAPAASSKRIFFSTAGDPTDTWDTTNKWLDVSYPITGMGALNNAVFVFGLGRTARIRGSIPPPDTDFIVDDPIFDVGCTDVRSICNYRDKILWANAEGIYISDGTALADLTRLAGMKTWWQDIMDGTEGFTTGSSYTVSGWTIAMEVFADALFYSVLSGSSEVDAGIVDLQSYTWTRFKNIDAVAMWRRPYPEEVFWGRRTDSRVAGTAQMFAPASANSADADGTVVLPTIETGYFMGDDLQKTVRRVALSYDLRDPGSANPTLTVSYILSPELTSYTALSPTLAETTAIGRKVLPINKTGRGVAFKIAQSGASSDTRFYSVDLDMAEREDYK